MLVGLLVEEDWMKPVSVVCMCQGLKMKVVGVDGWMHGSRNCVLLLEKKVCTPSN